MQPLAVDHLPEGDDWSREWKLDGFRCLLLKDGNRIQLLSRKNKEYTRFPTVAKAAGRTKAQQVIVDGEVVSVDRQGIPSFQALENPSEYPDNTTVFYGFDVLNRNGVDLLSQPLEYRRALLPELLEGTGLLVSKDIPGTAAQAIAWAHHLGLEGVVAKRKNSPYSANLTDAWLKQLLRKRQEFVVGGYHPVRPDFDSLVVGYYEDRALRFASRVRSGFKPYTRKHLLSLLEPLVTPQCPFADLPNSRSSRWGEGITAGMMTEMVWVHPVIVVQVSFGTWTAQGFLRHAEYIGLRSDKAAQEVIRETQHRL